MIDPPILYQSDTRWHSILVGDGPSTMGNAGCVITALDLLALALEAVEPGVLPPQANARFLAKPGCFVHWDEPTQRYLDGGDELVVPHAAPLVGLEAGDLIETPTAAQVAALLVDGGALLRVNTRNGTVGQHTISAVRQYEGGGFACWCPAVGRVDMAPDLTSTIMLDSHGKAVPLAWGKNDLRHYRVVNARGVRKAAV